MPLSSRDLESCTKEAGEERAWEERAWEDWETAEVEGQSHNPPGGREEEERSAGPKGFCFPTNSS